MHCALCTMRYAHTKTKHYALYTQTVHLNCVNLDATVLFIWIKSNMSTCFVQLEESKLSRWTVWHLIWGPSEYMYLTVHLDDSVKYIWHAKINVTWWHIDSQMDCLWYVKLDCPNWRNIDSPMNHRSKKSKICGPLELRLFGGSKFTLHRRSIGPSCLCTKKLCTIGQSKNPSGLCTRPYALCTMHYALCTMHYALCSMHYAL